MTAYAEKSNNLTTDDTNFKFSEKDHLFYLKQTDFKHLPLTNLQKTKINSALGLKQDATKYLSPKQEQWFVENRSEVLYLKDIKEVWWK